MIPVLVAVGIILVFLVIFIAGRPEEFKVTRTATIPAPPATVFAQVNDLRAWEAWSPWAKLDPNAKSTYEGPGSGVGSIMRWSGNNKIGEGAMTIVDSQPDRLVRFKLEFLRPFKATNTAEFVFMPEGPGTRVTWSMFGCNNLGSKIFGLLMDCEKIVGKDFDKGLAGLKSVVVKT
ncbi:MAG TPA: SRPBCC family protein [Desulfuromonadaceae bacterium]|nr:SRPBCC family protein [Desulfuromonadaceae bacterium]